MAEVKKPIAPTIRNMCVGDVEAWPIERYDTVRISAGRLNLMMRPEKRKYSVRVNGMSVEVVRMA